MQRRTRRTPAVLILLLLAAAALPTAPAAAKGLTALSVCGADGCVGRSDRPAELAPLLDGGPSVADPGRAPFLRLKEHMGDGGQTFGITTVIYLPGSGLQRTEEGTWRRPSPEAAALLQRLTRGVRPLPAVALQPHVPSGPPVPEASPASAPAPVVRHVADGGGDGPSGLLVAAGGGAALAVALGALAAVRGRRRGGASGGPAIG